MSLIKRTKKAVQFNTLDRYKIAHFVNAYVYGNVLILAAIMSLDSHKVDEGHAALLVIGTGLATFIAHVFAETQEYEVLHDPEDSNSKGRRQALIGALKDSRPILSSTFFPALVFALGYWNALPAELTLHLALWVIVWRIFRVGFVIAKHRGEKATFKLVLRGAVLAFAALLIAELKVILTH